MTSQSRFYQALLSDEAIPPRGLHTANGSDPAVRFAVYRNNVQSSLINALADNFPVVQALVGETFFRAMARLYVQQQPPGSPVLAWYGAQMPGFIAQFEPARSLPYLADVARLELLRTRAYHAADCKPLNHQDLELLLHATADPAHLVFGLHPSLHVQSSAFAVHALWAAHQGELAIEQVDPYQPQQCLIVRPHLDVLVIAVDTASAAFITQLQSGLALGQAAANCPPDFDLGQCLALLIHHGVICALSTSTTSRAAP